MWFHWSLGDSQHPIVNTHFEQCWASDHSYPQCVVTQCRKRQQRGNDFKPEGQYVYLLTNRFSFFIFIVQLYSYYFSFHPSSNFFLFLHQQVSLWSHSISCTGAQISSLGRKCSHCSPWYFCALLCSFPSYISHILLLKFICISLTNTELGLKSTVLTVNYAFNDYA